MTPPSAADRARVLFRADASGSIGHGHVMRCLALAEALRAAGAEPVFVQRDLPGNAHAVVDMAGFARWPLPVDGLLHGVADAQAINEMVQGRIDLLIVDHYQLDAAWLAALRPAPCRVLVIDDLANRPWAGDLLLDQNWHDDAASRYAGWWPGGAAALVRQGLFGPSHALLRSEFAQARAKQAPRDGQLRRLLVSFGGSDPVEASGACLAALHSAMPDLQIELLMGGGAASGPALLARWAGVPRVTVTLGASDVARRMAEADLFIGAGGSMTWERACLGLPGITLPVVDHQAPLCARLQAAGLGIDLGLYGKQALDGLVPAVQALLADPARCRQMSLGLARLCDGQGAARVAQSALALLVN